MSPRFFRIVVAFAVAGMIAFLSAIIFLGYSSASGAPILQYKEKKISDQQYANDVAAIVQFLKEIGFNEVTDTEMPRTIENRAASSRYEIADSLEYPVLLSRPISLRIYSDKQREGVLILFYARNPTWAVPFQKAALRKFAIIPLLSFWKQLTQKENA